MPEVAEITNKTGDIVYLGTGPFSTIGALPGGSLNLLNSTFSWTATGEEIRPKLVASPKIPQSLLPYKLLSTTTGSELHDISALLLIVLLLAVVSDRVVTDYHTTFEFKNWMRIKSNTNKLAQIKTSDPNSASIQAERLREISGLKVERLAEIFGISRTTYYKWISGSPLHDVHREHLLEVLPLVEEASQRLGSPATTNTWLLTPVSPGGKKPIDYLATQQYSIFRGFLLRERTGREVFQHLMPSNRVHRELSREDIENAHELLRPRTWRDEDNDVDIPSRDNEEV